MTRYFVVLGLSLLLIGAGAPNGQYPFSWRGQSLLAVGGADALKQAVVEYTSAVLENPRDGAMLRVRALLLVELRRYRPAIHDADTAMIYGTDEMYYYYLVGRATPSIECLRRAYRLACLRGDRSMISTVGKLLLDYETRYPYVTEKMIFP